MKYRLLDLLECQGCKKEFALNIFKKETIINELKFGVNTPFCKYYCGLKKTKITPDISKKNINCKDCLKIEIIDGILYCSCGVTFPVYKAIPRLLPKSLVDPEFYALYKNELNNEKPKTSLLDKLEAKKLKRTKITFDIEWTQFDYADQIYGHTEEEEEADFIKRTNFNITNSHNKLLLDAGCGIGRLIKNLDKYGVESVGVELSVGIDNACSENIFEKKIHFIQGNISNLPIKKGVFDYIYSKGVLQYTEDAEKSFKGLAGLSKKGGVLSITIYPKLSKLFNYFNSLARKISLTLPPKIIYYISFLLMPFFSLAWWLSGYSHRNISNSERAHMIFNWFSSEYQNFHFEEELIQWFDDSGYSEIETFTSPMGVKGRLK